MRLQLQHVVNLWFDQCGHRDCLSIQKKLPEVARLTATQIGILEEIAQRATEMPNEAMLDSFKGFLYEKVNLASNSQSRSQGEAALFSEVVNVFFPNGRQKIPQLLDDLCKQLPPESQPTDLERYNATRFLIRTWCKRLATFLSKGAHS